MANITANDIKEGAQFKTASGIIWIIDSVEGDKVRTSMSHGAKGNYVDTLQDCINFLNDENAIKL